MGKPIFLKKSGPAKAETMEKRFITLVSLGGHCGLLADHAYTGVGVQLETWFVTSHLQNILSVFMDSFPRSQAEN